MSVFRERVVTGILVDGDGTPVTNAQVRFKPTSKIGLVSTHTIIDRNIDVRTDSETGAYSVSLWCDEDSFRATDWKVFYAKENDGDIDTQYVETFSLAYEDGEPVELNLVIEEYLPDDEISQLSLTQKVDARTLLSAVRFDTPQELTAGQKLQAKENIGLDTLAVANGSEAAPSISGQGGFADSGFFWETLPLAGSKRLGIAIDGKARVFFHSGNDVYSHELGGFDGTGFLRVEGQLADVNRAKAGAVFSIEALPEDQTTSGSQYAVYIKLDGNAAVGNKPTYGLSVENSSKTNKASIGISSFVDGGTLAESGVAGVTPGTTVAGLFTAKDGALGVVGGAGDATGNSNPVPYQFGLIGLARYGTVANVAGYFGMHVIDFVENGLPVLEEGFAGAAIVCDNADTALDILVARDNGVTVFAIKGGGKIMSTGLSTYVGNTEALAGGLQAGDFYKTATGAVSVVY